MNSPLSSCSDVKSNNYATSQDTRGVIPAFEMMVGGQPILWDRENDWILITGVWKALGKSKADVLKVVDANPGLPMKKIRGGRLAIQGTWLPMESARALCVKNAWPLRHDLVPLFGDSFPSDCLAPSHPSFGDLKVDSLASLGVSTPSALVASVSRPSQGRARACRSLIASASIRRSSRASSRPVLTPTASGAASTPPLCSAGSAVTSGDCSVSVDATASRASVPARASRSSAGVGASRARGRISRARPLRASKRSHPYQRDVFGDSSRVAGAPASPPPSISRASSPGAISVASFASSCSSPPSVTFVGTSASSPASSPAPLLVFRRSAFTPVRPSFVSSPRPVPSFPSATFIIAEDGQLSPGDSFGYFVPLPNGHIIGRSIHQESFCRRGPRGPL
ncbi:Putative KLTH0G10098p [Rhizopus microsporus]|nr:Putative KLTH0G10098p [Rhizopus microsporus]